ncbi:MAG TPA: hypothetical protein VMT04_10030 [Terriglobales bacterium]|nr:hypothetical protein [Terriglobales bacterium]
MKEPTCIREGEIIQAVKTEIWSDELRSHIISCPFCQDTILIARSLNEVSDQTLLMARPPDSRLIWLRAKITRKQKQLLWFELLNQAGFILISLAIAICFLIWKSPWFIWTRIERAISGLSQWIFFSSSTTFFVFIITMFIVWLIAKETIQANKST